MEKLAFRIALNPPFRLDLTVWALRRRSNNIIDTWIANGWNRIFVIQNQPISIAVAQRTGKGKSFLEVSLTGSTLDSQIQKCARDKVVESLGVKTDLSDFYKMASEDRQLRSLATRFCGFKPPRFPSVFEAVVNGIACQQVSLNLGIILLSRLASKYGVSFPLEKTVGYSFPGPKDLCKLEPEDFRRLGFSRQKGLAIIQLSQAIITRQIDLEQLAMLNDNEVLEQLQFLRGVGRWTSEYVLLRGLGRLNIFPADDAGGRKGLQRLLKVQGKLDYEETRNLVERWKPFGGLVYFHLLLNRLFEEGYLVHI